MQQKIIYHLVSGFLGARKKHFIQQLAMYKLANEHCLILVNEITRQYYPIDQLKVNDVSGRVFFLYYKHTFSGCANKMITSNKPDCIFITASCAEYFNDIKVLLQGEFYHSLLVFPLPYIY